MGIDSTNTVSLNNDTNAPKKSNHKGAIIGAGAIGGAVGLGGGCIGATKIADKFISANINGLSQNSKLTNKYIDTLSDLVAKFAKGDKITDCLEKSSFFDSVLRPLETRQIEEFIKSNGFNMDTDPKIIKEAFKKFAKEDECMKESIKKYFNAVQFGTGVKRGNTETRNPIKNIKNLIDPSPSLTIKKEGKKVIKNCKIAMIGGAIAGAALIAGITLGIIKSKKNKEEKLDKTV